MTITIPPDVERLALESAAAEGVSVEAYVAQLIREDEWADVEPITEDDPEFEDVRAAVMEGLEQAERGEMRPLDEVVAEIRAKYGFSR